MLHKISSFHHALLAIVIVIFFAEILYYIILSRRRAWENEEIAKVKTSSGVSPADLWVTQHAYLTRESIVKLRGNSCKMPILNPFAPAMVQYFHPKNIDCSNGPKFYFRSHVENQDTDNPQSMVIAFREVPKPLRCCYEHLRFTNKTKYKSLPSKHCNFFTENKTVVPPESEYIIIKCWNTARKNMNISNEQLKKTLAHHFEILFYVRHPSNELLRKKNELLLKEQDKKEDLLNVIIIGFDQVSRANFIRLMRETFHQLRTEMDAIDLQGFNKMGDATLNNTLALLTGHEFGEITKNPNWWDDKKRFFDRCPWIWKKFSEKGYITGYADDYVSVFNYRFSGFEYKPTDYYLEPFMGWFLNWTMARWNKFGRSYNCIGNEQAIDLLQDHARKFSSSIGKHPYFHFMWISRTHELPGYPSLADKSTLNTLRHFEKNGVLNRSLVILTSDHGWRSDPIMLQRQARLENRLSFAFLLLPQWFREKYPAAYSNMKENQYRLTTPYDIHSTLEDMLNPSKLLSAAVIDKRVIPHSKGISLFLPIPQERTCATAGIDEEWCACTFYKSFAVDSPVALRLGKYAVKTLNSWIRPFPSCDQFILSQVISAEVKSSDGESIGFGRKEQFRITFGTRPMLSYFEVTIFTDVGYWQSEDMNKISMSTEVFRLDRYNKAECIDVYDLKKICHCKHKDDTP